MARMKTVLVTLAFLAILGSLGAAGIFMLRGSPDDKRKGNHMARALAFRVGFSILLFLCILLAWAMGWIQPSGIPAGA